MFSKFIEFGRGDGSDGKAIMANNADWLDELKYIPFLREVGSLFSVNRMLSFESVKSRLDREQSLSFLEFNYMILQAYDFSELNRRHGCLLQMGGSDQWGNIVNGIDLSRRMNGAEVYGLTSPLLAKADGSKMGKSADGAIWLNADMLSPYEFWQFWRNTLDADVGRFLKLYTELPVDECERLGALEGSEINDAKIRLANEVTTLCHGADAASAAEAPLARSSSRAGIGDDLPTVEVGSGELPISLAQLFVRSGLVQVRQGGPAAGRRWRRADERSGGRRSGADAGGGRSGHTGEAERGQEAARAGSAGGVGDPRPESRKVASWQLVEDW